MRKRGLSKNVDVLKVIFEVFLVTGNELICMKKKIGFGVQGITC